MTTKHSLELRNQISREFYWNNREKMLSYQKEYGARMREEARNRKKYDSREELIEAWNEELRESIEHQEDEMMKNFLKNQIKINEEIFLTNGAQE